MTNQIKKRPKYTIFMDFLKSSFNLRSRLLFIDSWKGLSLIEEFFNLQIINSPSGLLYIYI